MSAANRRRGSDAELKVRDLYRERGWQAHKTSDSSVVDVIASLEAALPFEMRRGGLNRLALTRYLEVKASSVKRGPYADFPPHERAALSAAAREAGAEAWLVWWPKGRSVEHVREIPEDDWPEAREAA